MARTGARASTARVFVFDERLGAREGDEGEKVLAFFPSGTSANDMASAIGLVEGVAGFVSPFAPVPSGPSPDAPLAQTLRTSRRRVACRRCEPGVWWALSLDADAAPERAVRDEALQSLLARAHAHFVLLHGGVQRVLDDAGHDAARLALAPIVADLGVRLSPSRGPHAGSLIPSLPTRALTLDPGAAFLPTLRHTHNLLRAVVDATMGGKNSKSSDHERERNAPKVLAAPEVLAAAVLRDDRLAYATLALQDARVFASYAARCLAPGAAAGESETKKTARVWGGDSIGVGPRAEALAAAVREEANAATRFRDDERRRRSESSRSPPFMASEWRVGKDGFARWDDDAGDDASFVVPAWIRVDEGDGDDSESGSRDHLGTRNLAETQLCAIRRGATTLALFLAPDARLTPFARHALLHAVADTLPELDAALETAAGPGGADRAWHAPGLRYAYRDESSLATRASPPAKIATLAPETCSAVEDVWNELERRRDDKTNSVGADDAGAESSRIRRAGRAAALSTRVRAGRDAWIAGEVSAEGRTMIVVAEGAGGTLLEASAAARKFADTHFEGVFDDT